MKRLLNIAVLSLSLTAPSSEPISAQDVAPVSAHSITSEHSAVPTGRVRAGIACGAELPTSLEVWRKESDAIVQVRIGAQSAFDWQSTDSIITEHEVTVLDVFKWNPRTPGFGGTMTVFQHGGTVQRADGPDTLIWNGFDIMSVGTEWILFLQWSNELEGFTIYHAEDGAFRILDESVATLAGGVWGELWRGKPASVLIDALHR